MIIMIIITMRKRRRRWERTKIGKARVLRFKLKGHDVLTGFLPAGLDHSVRSHVWVIVTYQTYAQAHIGSAAGRGRAWAESCPVTMELLHNIMETYVREALHCCVVLVKKKNLKQAATVFIFQICPVGDGAGEEVKTIREESLWLTVWSPFNRLQENSIYCKCSH